MKRKINIEAQPENPLGHSKRHATTFQETKQNVPFELADVMTDLRLILKGEANYLLNLGIEGDVVSAFLGFSAGSETSFGGASEIHTSLDLDRFGITGVLENAYNFAFQTGARGCRHAMIETEYFQMLTFRRSSPQHMGGNDPTPIDDTESAICRMIDTADARMRLGWEFDLTIRQLALLASMSEPVVRTSLSKVGIRTAGGRNDDGLAGIPIDDARRWLEGRRGFVATLKPEPTDVFYTDDLVRLLKANGFEAGLGSIASGADLSRVAQDAHVDGDWLLEMASGRPAALDLDSLARVAAQLGADTPTFVGKAVENILRTNAAQKGRTS